MAPADAPATPPEALPQRLRAATQPLHALAERSGVMALLMAGRLPQAGYRALLMNLKVIYAALEAGLQRQAAQPWMRGIPIEALRRLPSLEADLSGQPAPGGAIPAPTRAYADRLDRLTAAGDPALLAHVYTRYLGDLHGGQIMARIVARRYPGQGTAFHDFGDEAEVRRHRERLRAALSAVVLSADQADAVVAEACWSFEQHQRIFEALAAADAQGLPS
ncbi:MAG: biliverdin-producing heme oxygenase [Rubrivivax sp.]|nr:biliverdin-producing heme oxygenase [Rubrivivax sp.]